MTTISSSLPTTTFASSSSTGAGTSSVASTSDTSLSQIAVKLASDAGVIATLSSSTPASNTYSAAGLLNSFVDAGNAASTSTSTSTSTPSSTTSTTSPAVTAQQSLDEAMVGSLSSSSGSSGLYTSTGGLQDLPTTNVNANWSTVLKTNPSAASTVIADSVAQGVIGSLSTST